MRLGVLKRMRKTVKMNNFLVEILKNETFDNFTVIQLRDKYLESSTSFSDSNEARKYVYKQILRLVGLGVLIKKGKKNSQTTLYKKTGLFEVTIFISKENGDEMKNKSTSRIVKKSNDSSSLKQLEFTLNEYKVDMMSALGETEEYIKLLDTFPEMKEQLRESYELARDRSSKLLGQIKALKNAVSIASENK
tara:strand:- start:262 stop:837 length:576 start_codon:yes stop_codon:yes gene_type:complete